MIFSLHNVDIYNAGILIVICHFLNTCETEIKSDILKKRKLAKDQELETDKREKVPTSEKILQEKKKKTEMNCDSTVRSRQVERILRPYCFSHGFLVSFL